MTENPIASWKRRASGSGRNTCSSASVPPRSACARICSNTSRRPIPRRRCDSATSIHSTIAQRRYSGWPETWRLKPHAWHSPTCRPPRRATSSHSGTLGILPPLQGQAIDSRRHSMIQVRQPRVHHCRPGGHRESVLFEPRAEVGPGSRHAVPGRTHAAAVTGGDAAASHAGRPSGGRFQQAAEAAPGPRIGQQPQELGLIPAVARQPSVGPAWIVPVRQPQSGGCCEALSIHDAHDLRRSGLRLLAEIGSVLQGNAQQRSQLALGELPAGRQQTEMAVRQPSEIENQPLAILNYIQGLLLLVASTQSPSIVSRHVVDRVAPVGHPAMVQSGHE